MNHQALIAGQAPSRSKSVTSIGFGFADPSAGFRHLFALLRRRFASASLRSVPQSRQ
jgi:hypothetical protein